MSHDMIKTFKLLLVTWLYKNTDAGTNEFPLLSRNTCCMLNKLTWNTGCINEEQ
jgi:hypothetical protein